MCDRYVGAKDMITVSVWNQKKVHKKQGAGFLGCVRIMSNAIQRLKDTGCKAARLSLVIPIHTLYVKSGIK